MAIPAKYVIGTSEYTAVTRSIGSKLLVLRTGEPLPWGRGLQIFIDWPVLLEGEIPLSLVIRGKVIWNDGQDAGVSISNHEFRLRRRTAPVGEQVDAPRLGAAADGCGYAMP